MMPDKIYIFQDGDDFWYKPEEWKTPPPHRVEYLRKDALLEWLQKEYEANKWFHETHAKPDELHIGRCEAYKQVIDKIESL